MSIIPPQIVEHPGLQQNALDYYLVDRMRDGSLGIYSSFLLHHEAVRIGRRAYRQPAWNHRLGISGLLTIWMHALTAKALRLEAQERIALSWLDDDLSFLEEQRAHFLTDRVQSGEAARVLLDDEPFLRQLVNMRKRYDSLSDARGPYPVEVFPWDFAEPEQEVLSPGSRDEFQHQGTIDPEVERIVVELCSGYWA